MDIEKVQVAYRIDIDTYHKIARIALRKKKTVPQFTRYILEKYLEDTENHDKQKTTANP